ncbi:GNAT family N-acetyltransferase [Rhodococcus gordoniae]
MLIRRELPADIRAIADVHRAAFAPFAAPGHEPVEPGLVASLRASDAWLPPLSLVAEDGVGAIVGHVVATRGHVGSTPALGLGPLGVRPDLQRSGAGSALVHAVLGAADALDESLVLLLGHPGYYPRFGFVPAAELGISPDVEEWASHFQARALTAHDPALRGTFRYAEPFYDLEDQG